MEALKSYTFLFVSSVENTTLLHSDEEGALNYYTVEDLIFPFEDNFGIEKFHEAVQTCVSSGRRGNQLLRRTLFIDIDEDNPKESQLELNFGW